MTTQPDQSGFGAWLEDFVAKLDKARDDALDNPHGNRDACIVLAAKAGTANFILGRWKAMELDHA